MIINYFHEKFQKTDFGYKKAFNNDVTILQKKLEEG